jgi:LysR family transcriptional regulator, transcriptional activator of the cysJI operon
MNLYISKRHLEVFLEVSRSGTMSAAADILCVTQPAVSQSVAELEQQLGVRLFDRFRRRLSLTYAGEIFLDHVRRINSIFLEAGFRMEAIAELREERLRIGASMTIGSFILPSRIRRFTEAYPGIRIGLVVDNTARIREGLLGNQLDIGVVEGPLEHPDLITRFLAVDPLCLVCSSNHPWSRTDMIDKSEIARENFIMREDGSGTRSIIESLFTRYGIDYSLGHTINNIEGIKKVVTAGLGVTVLPRIAVVDEIERGELSETYIEGIVLRREFRYAIHKDKTRYPVLAAWVEHLRASMESTE